MAKNQKDYAIIKIPRELAEKIDLVLEKFGYQTRSEFVKEAIRHLLRETEMGDVSSLKKALGMLYSMAIGDRSVLDKEIRRLEAEADHKKPLVRKVGDKMVKKTLEVSGALREEDDKED